MIPTKEVREYLRTFYLNHCDSTTENAILTTGEHKLRKWLQIDDPEHKHQFITIALPNNLGILELKKKIYRLTHKYLEGALLCCEFNSASGENLHVHILKEGVYSKTRLIRDLARKFKIDENFVDVRLGKRESDYQNRLAYIKGEKSDELKQEKVYLDQLWRQQNGLQDIYTL